MPREDASSAVEHRPRLNSVLYAHNTKPDVSTSPDGANVPCSEAITTLAGGNTGGNSLRVLSSCASVSSICSSSSQPSLVESVSASSLPPAVLVNTGRTDASFGQCAQMGALPAGNVLASPLPPALTRAETYSATVLASALRRARELDPSLVDGDEGEVETVDVAALRTPTLLPAVLSSTPASLRAPGSTANASPCTRGSQPARRRLHLARPPALQLGANTSELALMSPTEEEKASGAVTWPRGRNSSRRHGLGGGICKDAQLDGTSTTTPRNSAATSGANGRAPARHSGASVGSSAHASPRVRARRLRKVVSCRGAGSTGSSKTHDDTDHAPHSAPPVADTKTHRQPHRPHPPSGHKRPSRMRRTRAASGETPPSTPRANTSSVSRRLSVQLWE